MRNIKKEYKDFLDDIEKNIKNKEDLDFIKERFTKFSDTVISELNDLSNLRNDKIDKIEEMQKTMDEKITQIQQVLTHIENDIYIEDDYDLEIICPYCSYNFILEDGEEKTEIQCPECNNIIELDWFDVVDKKDSLIIDEDDEDM